MKQPYEGIANGQAAYYGNLFEKYGPGVDSVASGNQIYKDLRYAKLSALFSADRSFSLQDVGCGVGHYFEFLKRHFPDREIEYSGTEITPAFVDHCRQVYPDNDFQLRDLAAGPFDEQYDYLIFAGTFYHLAGAAEHDFRDFVERMLSNGFQSARKGIAFNLVTSYVDYRLPDLFYADVGEVIDFTCRELSRFFTIDHASPLFEHTICVYKPGYMQDSYPDQAFKKYF